MGLSCGFFWDGQCLFFGDDSFCGFCLSSEKKRLPPGQRAIKQILRWGIDHPGITPANPKIDLENLHVNCRWRSGQARYAFVARLSQIARDSVS